MPLLSAGEAVVLQEPCAMGDRSGTLFLTNLRVVFEGKKSQGLVHQLVRGAQTVALMDIPLWQVSDVHADKPLIGRASLRIDAMGRSYRFGVRDATHWRSAIGNARALIPHPGSPVGGLGQPVVVNVQAAQSPPAMQHTIERQTVKVRCRFCGNLGDESIGKCPNCGAVL